jgi:hypothetical protein
MLDRGRKAGLYASDLYRALSAHRPPPGDDAAGKTDSNGYIPQVQANGQRKFEQPDKA